MKMSVSLTAACRSHNNLKFFTRGVNLGCPCCDKCSMNRVTCEEETRRERALSRAAAADGLMADCRLCAWDCGVDRTRGPAGKCHAPARARVFQQRVEWAGEAELMPTRLINFSGCNFRCAFCLTGRDSQDARRGEPFDGAALETLLQAEQPLFRTVTIEGGEASVFLPDALRAIAAAPAPVPVVWKTNAYMARSALELIRGCADVFLADYKFGNDACARRLAGVDRYLETLHQNLTWARKNTRLMVRHLLMPGHIDCCLAPALQWLSDHMPDAELSILNGFLPSWNSARAAELLRPFTADEIHRARRLIRRSGLPIVPWAVAAPASPLKSQTEPDHDQISIGTDGSIKVAFMSAELNAALQSLKHEFPMVVNL